MKTRTCVLVLGLLLAASSLRSHGGGLDKNGCHTNRKTGDYHCHGAPITQSSVSASTRSTTRTPTIKVSRGIARTIRASDFELVMTTQALLRQLGHPVSVTGIHGDPTSTAIREFQHVNSILEDGEVSGALLVKLAETVAKLGCQETSSRQLRLKK